MLSALSRTRRAVPVARGLLDRAMASAPSLSALGIDQSNATVHYNLSYDEIAERETAEGLGRWTTTGAYMITTGKFTGRSPKDKYFVEQEPSKEHIWWGEVNKPMTPEVYEDLKAKATSHLSGRDTLYVFDGFCGANPNSRKAVRFVTPFAWQHQFVKNMFISPTEEELEGFEPEFTVLNAATYSNPDWETQGLNSENFVTFNLEQNLAIIGGTHYGGEMKKGIFSIMNMQLPLNGIMAMHCSANLDPQTGDTALFFGLSGTGKTTLSADPKRMLIGDDEHGWDGDGIFNFEGGCYAKTIDLKRENEPEIWDAIKRNALLENIKLDDEGNCDYTDTSITQNGRVSYPLSHIPNHVPSSMGGHPSACIFLTADAYGVLPPISKLSEKQAMYHFLSGYTAKVAGTERGVTEPEATFSACFGAAFLPLHPTKYAALLEQKLLEHGTKTYLVNTGWTGGVYGTGHRMSIADTRACIDAVLNGSIEESEFVEDPVFGVSVPVAVPGVNSDVLVPRNTWADKDAYDATAAKLAGMFVENFKKYAMPGVPDYSPFGPQQ